MSRGLQIGGGDITEQTCRCHLPLDPPAERHWWPARDPEPDTTVRAVAMAGRQPWLLRAERHDDGWHTAGCFAAHPSSTPARGWGDVGRCWAGTHHAVLDVSAWLADRHTDKIGITPSEALHQNSSEHPWTRLPGVGPTVPVLVRRPNDRARH